MDARNLDVFVLVTVFVVISFLLYFVVPYAFPQDRLSAVYAIISSVLTMVGLLMANRLGEKLRNPKLNVRLDFYKFEDAIRVFAEVGNAPGRGTAKDSKAFITIKSLSEDGSERPLHPSELLTDMELRSISELYESLEHPNEGMSIEGKFIP